ncbi:MAG: sensor histidine kinase [Rubrobacter sp.]|nr:sensor histidine kinase [Rubrobacter sp.]
MARAYDKETSRAAGDPRRNPAPLGWTLFTGVWLLFPVGFVFQAFRAGLSPVGMMAFVASMAAFVAVFVWLMLRYPFPDPGLSLGGVKGRLGLVAILAALAIFVEAAYGEGVPWRFMYVVVARASVLPTRYAAWAVAAATVYAGVFYEVRSGWEAVAAEWGYLIPFALIGVGMIAVSRLVTTIRELDEAKREISRLAVSEERLRFARDLHDLLGHSLSLITLKSELAGRLLPEDPEKAAGEVRDIESVARRSLREVREAVAGYRRPTLSEELDGAREMLEAAGIEARIEHGAEALPVGADSILAWTVREGATNVIRHSRARTCHISLTQSEDEVRAEITDDGIGGEPKNNAGSGLRGLAERVEAGGGEFEAGTSPEGGFRLYVKLPSRGAEAPATKADGTREEARR